MNPLVMALLGRQQGMQPGQQGQTPGTVGPVPYNQHPNYVAGVGQLPQGIDPKMLEMLRGAPNMNGYHDS